MLPQLTLYMSVVAELGIYTSKLCGTFSNQVRVIPFLFASTAQMHKGTVSSARAVLADRLQNGLFALLRLDYKVELCKTLLEQSQAHPDIVSSPFFKPLFAVLTIT